MVSKILIANRGEVACRIARTARKMGIQTVAVYSDADTNSMHLRLADEVVYIGPSPAPSSYLNIKSILNAIKISGADAVHPGYGFLSENAKFAETIIKNGITFIGPSPDAISKMGDKVQAKKIAKDAGVNVVPGYIGAIKTEKDALKIAAKIGYPIMLKAVAGGGGKGIRIVHNETEMQQAYSSTKNEARNSFADERTFIEKYIERPRHIEIQVLGDQHGNYICLGERECSIQRHHQKVIEEAPSAFIDEKIRKKMYAQAIALAKKVGYFSVGTVEYIVNPEKHFYFMEMNTRLQVEHPVTELVTGIDLVEQMIRVARGEKLAMKQSDVKIEGWATECRIYAEDPSCGFLPSIGKITTYTQPKIGPGVRIESGVFEGGEVSMFYDAMISKVCIHGATRLECIAKTQKALGEYIIRGISHNISFLQTILASPKYIASDISTNFLEEEYKSGFTGPVLSDEASAVILSAGLFIYMAEQKRAMTINCQLRTYQRGHGTRLVIMLDERKYPVTVRQIEDGYKISFESRRLYITSKWMLGHKLFHCNINGHPYSLQLEKSGLGLKITYMGYTIMTRVMIPAVGELTKYMRKVESKVSKGDVVANMPGMVRNVKVSLGDEVMKDQPIIILEAMKMENILTAPLDGVVKSILIEVGQSVMVGDSLISIKPKVVEE
jgi:propionyl-CoA carboxylase alpha chain